MSYSILNDREIRQLCVGTDTPMIAPFSEHQEAALSYGLGSFGYTIRLANRFKVLRPAAELEEISPYLDPLRYIPDQWQEIENDHAIIIPAGGFALAHSLETFHIVDDAITICMGKSSYARVALVVNVTPFEPGWRGVATLELSNTSGLPLKVYPGLGIAQLLFFRGNRPEITYGDRKGRYQDQTGITPAKGA